MPRILFRRLVTAYLLLLVPGLFAQDDPGSIYVLSREQARIVVLPAGVSAQNDSAEREPIVVDLPIADPSGIFPTPGGKYVFVVDGTTGEIVTIDSEDHTIHEVFSLNEGVPRSIDFSPQGHTAVLRFPSAIVSYDHAAGRLSNPRRTPTEADSLPAAQVAMNRRGTRAYTGVGESLIYLGTEDAAEYDRVDIGFEVPVWSMAPDFRFLWGVSDDRVVVVDERRSRLSVSRNGNFLLSPPVFVRTAGSAFLAAGNSAELLRFDDRRHRIRERIPLPAQAVAFSGDESRGVWILTVEGEVLRYDTVSDDLAAVRMLEEGFDALSYVGFKPNGGFACF